MTGEQPLLVIVTGPPASGKTSIAREIATDLSIPAIHKDEYKERLADLMPGDGLEWSQRLGRAAYEIILLTGESIVNAGGSCLLEANFHPVLSLPRLTGLASSSRVAQVVCSGDPEALMRRYLDRHAAGTRHPVHLDTNELRLETLLNAFRRDHCLDLPGPVFPCDTTAPEPVDVTVIVDDLRAMLEQ